VSYMHIISYNIYIYICTNRPECFLFQDMELDFVLDLHAHSSLQGVFVYGNTYDDVYRCEICPYLMSAYLLHHEVVVKIRRHKFGFAHDA